MMFDALGFSADQPQRASPRIGPKTPGGRSDDEIYCQPCVWRSGTQAGRRYWRSAAGTSEPRSAWSTWQADANTRPARRLDRAGPNCGRATWAFQYANPRLSGRRRSPSRRQHRLAVRDRRWIACRARRRRIMARRSSAPANGSSACKAATAAGPFRCRRSECPPQRSYSVRRPARCSIADRGCRRRATCRCWRKLATPPRSARSALHRLFAADMGGSWFGRWGMNYIDAWSRCSRPQLRRFARARRKCWSGPVGSPRSRTAAAAQGEDGKLLNSIIAATSRERNLPTAWALLGFMAAGRSPGGRARR